MTSTGWDGTGREERPEDGSPQELSCRKWRLFRVTLSVHSATRRYGPSVSNDRCHPSARVVSVIWCFVVLLDPTPTPPLVTQGPWAQTAHVGSSHSPRDSVTDVTLGGSDWTDCTKCVSLSSSLPDFPLRPYTLLSPYNPYRLNQTPDSSEWVV